MKKILLILVLFSGIVSADTTIYLVRHAEKIIEEGIKDPDLTAIGLFRAQNIAKQLSSVGVTKIFSTATKRTMQTAQPLADYQGIKISQYDAKDLEKFAQELKQFEGVALVVGHSNTTPQLTQLLSNKEINAIEEDEYDNLYQVIITEHKTIVNRLKSIPSFALNKPALKLEIKKTYSPEEMAPILEKINENK
ncbi:MAG: histidine phosphatase family protein [Marinicellaceae bacterium]